VAASATSIAVSPDGLRIAWTGAGSAGPEIFADALPPTGAPTALGAGELPVFSPDGQRLAFRRDGALMLWDAAAGPPRLAATGMAAAWPSFSPDGSRALFFRTWTASQSGALSGDLYAIDPLVESASAQLVASGASPRRVDSPDRQWSALFAKGALALVEWRAGGPYATSFGSAVQVGDAAFSPDSAHLAYVAAGGLRLRALADGAETPVAAGVISGRYAFAGADRIAAVQGAGASGAGDLVARPVGSAGEAGLVAEGAAEVRALGGRRIAYTVLGGPHAGLWVVDLE
jgi:hypothetical protein